MRRGRGRWPLGQPDGRDLDPATRQRRPRLRPQDQACLRSRAAPSPTSASPSIATEPGSGTAAGPLAGPLTRVKVTVAISGSPPRGESPAKLRSLRLTFTTYPPARETFEPAAPSPQVIP